MVNNDSITTRCCITIQSLMGGDARQDINITDVARSDVGASTDAVDGVCAVSASLSIAAKNSDDATMAFDSGLLLRSTFFTSVAIMSDLTFHVTCFTSILTIQIAMIS